MPVELMTFQYTQEFVHSNINFSWEKKYFKVFQNICDFKNVLPSSLGRVIHKCCCCDSCHQLSFSSS